MPRNGECPVLLAVLVVRAGGGLPKPSRRLDFADEVFALHSFIVSSNAYAVKPAAGVTREVIHGAGWTTDGPPAENGPLDIAQPPE